MDFVDRALAVVACVERKLLFQDGLHCGCGRPAAVVVEGLLLFNGLIQPLLTEGFLDMSTFAVTG